MLAAVIVMHACSSCCTRHPEAIINHGFMHERSTPCKLRAIGWYSMVAVWYLRVTQATRVFVVCQGGWLASCGGSTDPLEDLISSRLPTNPHHHCTAPLFDNGASLFHELVLQQKKATVMGFWPISPGTETFGLSCGQARSASHSPRVRSRISRWSSTHVVIICLQFSL